MADLITRIGVASNFFDKQIDGQPGDGDGLLNTNPVRVGLFQKVIGVGWGGGKARFVLPLDRAADGKTSLQHIDIVSSRGTRQFTNDGSGGFNNATFGIGQGDVICAAYGLIGADANGKGGTPSFVAVGSNGGGSIGVGFIMHSRDGVHWSKVFTLPNNGSPGSPTGAVVYIVTWDGKQFWAAGNKSTNDDGGEDHSLINQIDILLSSGDGKTWSQAGSQTINFDDWPSYQSSSGLIVPHLDGRVASATPGISGSPSGVFGEKKVKKSDGSTESIIMNSSTGCSIDTLFGSFAPGAGGSVQTSGGAGPIGAISFRVGVMSYGDGKIWMAASGTDLFAAPRAAVSTDDGETWADVDLTASNSFPVSLCGAKLSDVK